MLDTAFARCCAGWRRALRCPVLLIALYYMPHRRVFGGLALCVVVLSAAATSLRAQTDYFNPDHGRPTLITDAYTVEFGSFEFHSAPLRLERARGGQYHWGLEPQLSWGLLPLTQLEIGFPLAAIEQGGTPSVRGLSGVDVALTRTLKVEGTRLPAIAAGASVLLPWGSLAPTAPYLSMRVMSTRTFPGLGRLHLNAETTVGPGGTRAAAPTAGPGTNELARWMAGAAIDHALPTRSLLWLAELYTRRPLQSDRPQEWTASTGVRWQALPQWTLDAGIGRRFTGAEPAWSVTFGTSYAFSLNALARRAPRGPQWNAVAEQFYLPAPHNWTFRDTYASADRLFNAFDYGHAILYEVLRSHPTETAVPRLEEQEYAFLTRHLLVRPPRLPLAEVAVMPNYARLAPEAKLMFEWAHLLHRQVYDVLASEAMDSTAKDAAIADIYRYYRTRPDLAFSEVPKSMALMQEQPYSLAFRQSYPKFNGLIWSYHWLQMALYEPLVVGATAEARQAGVAAAVAHFREMLQSPPDGFPVVMPMTPAIAPTFAARFPALAIVFDNLHSMHDVVSDILANPAVASSDKRAEILRAAAAYRDDTTEVMTVAGWRKMSLGMGLENQGGPAVGLLAPGTRPTMPRGAVMRHDRDGNPIGAGHQHH